MIVAVAFVLPVVWISDAYLRVRRKVAPVVRGTQARLQHPTITKANEERDAAMRMVETTRAREWRAINILAALNDLQSRSGATIDQKEFSETWRRAWNKPLSAAPTLTLDQLEAARQFPEWEVDDLAAKIDPGAYLDDSRYMGSAIGRREAARGKARDALRGASPDRVS